MNNPNANDCLVIETISVYKFQQVLDSLQLARKVALDQVAYGSEARSLKSLQMSVSVGEMKVQSLTELWIILILQAVT